MCSSVQINIYKQWIVVSQNVMSVSTLFLFILFLFIEASIVILFLIIPFT